MHWRIKGIVQKSLCYVPNGERIHAKLQRRMGGLSNFQAECESKIEDWRILAGHLQKIGLEFSGSSFFEIGTGWYPTLPICTALAGASNVQTYDLNPHLDKDLTIACARIVRDNIPSIASLSGRSESVIKTEADLLVSRLESGMDITWATDERISYKAPADARNTGLADNSIDFVFSNSVLEHVPPRDISAIMKESLRIVKPGRYMFHSVNCGDHYAYVDRKVNQLHYLRYSDAAWRLWNNDFQYQNRLRAVEIVKMAEELGFQTVINTAKASDLKLKQLSQIKVADCFSQFSPEELCITSIDLVSKKC